MTIQEAISGKISPYAIVGVNIEKKPKTKPSIQVIEELVCKYYKIEPDILHVRCRRREVVKAKQTIMYLCRKHTDETLRSIGDFFGGYDHTSVLSNARTAQNIIDTDEDYRADIEYLNKYFTN